MEPDEIIKNIEQAYDAAIVELNSLDEKKRMIIKQYIKSLEEKKIQEIKDQLNALSSHVSEN
jgi:hypothetical protein